MLLQPLVSLKIAAAGVVEDVDVGAEAVGGAVVAAVDAFASHMAPERIAMFWVET